MALTFNINAIFCVLDQINMVFFHCFIVYWTSYKNINCNSIFLRKEQFFYEKNIIPVFS